MPLLRGELGYCLRKGDKTLILPDMICPHGWNNCQECANEGICRAGRYEHETDLDVVIKAAEISEKVVDAAVKESVHKIRGTLAEGFLKMSEKERWEDLRKYHIPSLMDKVPVPAGEGSPGSGSSNGKKSTNKGTKKTQYKWGEFA